MSSEGFQFDTEAWKNSAAPKWNKQLVLLFWFEAILTLLTLQARQCELMATLPPSQSALSRPQ